MKNERDKDERERKRQTVRRNAKMEIASYCTDRQISCASQ